MGDIKESDWKIFKELHPVALQRAFDQTIREIQLLSNEEGKTSQERFWNTFNYMKNEQKEIAHLFDDYRRSTAMLQLVAIHRRNYITPQEVARFSPEARELVSKLRSL